MKKVYKGLYTRLNINSIRAIIKNAKASKILLKN